ncbi:hypothetical protein PRK78_003316 [Emydomyces testavorans]|uniref:Uncharacterized protein n=1 Tax=Emydomyces testavorans TaxID=2070801 RepID=A0AAF0DFT9_9EURO|nr:hypothetical protein PRK78_003316 [Emydomyces testavorans]
MTSNQLFTVVVGSNTAHITSGTSLPQHLSFTSPVGMRLAFGQAYQAAEKARIQFTSLHKTLHYHLYRLCPVENISHFKEHCSAVDRLLSWADEHANILTNTLAPPAKIPSFVLKFHVEERAYRDYEQRYRERRNAFYNGALRAWRQARSSCEEMLRGCEIAPMDRMMCWEWWGRFLAEVARWESKLDELVVPGWAWVVEELASLIEERVDLGDYWADDI